MKEHPIKYIKTYGLKIWFIQIIILFINKFFPHIKILKKLKAKKHQLIMKYLKTNYESLINEYKNKKIENIASNKVWVLWYQGANQMPKIVNACYKSIKNHLKESEVILLSQDNIKKYINLPDYIMKKYEDNKICAANFSDIIRMNLLKDYGGLWLDSTIYVTQDLSLSQVKKIKTIKAPTNDISSISKGLWTGFCLGSLPTKLYSFIYDFFLEFFKKVDIQIDYFLVDYIIRIAYEEFPEIKSALDNNLPNNEHTHLLCSKLNEKYNQKEYAEILKENFLHKLSFKIPLKEEGTKETTYYQEILKRSK